MHEMSIGTAMSTEHAVSCVCSKHLGRDIRNGLQGSKSEDYFSANLDHDS